MLNIDWATAKGIADEATLDRFVALHGGIRVSELIGNVQFENADYLFPHENVIAELKILETEFANTSAFKLKLDAMLEQFAKEKRTIGGPFVGKPYSQEFIRSFILLFKPILARIAKKANRQIRSTKKHLHLPNARGLLICVNDEFRGLEPEFVMGLCGKILNGSYTSIDGFIYHTNHYIDVPWSEYAHLIWTTMYSDDAPMSLVDFVDNLGRRWFDFCENEGLPADTRVEGPRLSLAGARAIKRNK
jgi:hypothetical protein